MQACTQYHDPALEAAKRRIREAEDKLADMEDQQALAEDDDNDFPRMIRDQQDYLAGLHAGYNRMLSKRGM